MRGGLLIAPVALMLLAAAPDPNRELLRQAERARAAELAAQNDAALRARAAQAEADRLATQRVNAAARLRASEAATAEALAKLDTVSERRRAAEQRLAARTADLAPLLPLIERLSLFPAETLLAVPATPTEALRGVLVLKGITRQIERDAESVRREKAQLDALAHDSEDAARRLTQAQVAQAAQAQALDQQIAAAQRVILAAQDPGAGASQRAAEQASHAGNLRSALVTIETERQADEARAREDAARAEQQRHDAEAAEAKRRAMALAAPAGPGLADPHGQLTAPVAGTVVRGFGDGTEAGPANGMSYRAPPNARVVSPCGGRIVFAGPFRSFGLLLIVDCGGGYHFVLAGFDRLDVQVGRQVQPGEPVGVMPGWDPRVSGDRPTLYVELRRDGVPVNPTPWLNVKG